MIGIVSEAEVGQVDSVNSAFIVNQVLTSHIIKVLRIFLLQFLIVLPISCILLRQIVAKIAVELGIRIHLPFHHHYGYIRT